MGQWSRGSDESPFIELVPPERAEGGRMALYAELERIRGPGRVSNLFRAYSAFPARTCVAVTALPVRERMKIETVAFRGTP